MTERFATLVNLCEKSCERFAARPLFGTKGRAGWRWTRYGEFRALVDECRAGLSALGIGAGDKIALVSNNCIEWAACAYGAYGLAAAVVPMYEEQLPDDWKFILGDCGAKVAFAANAAITARLAAVAPHLPALRHIVRIDAPPDDPASFAALLERGRAVPVPSRQPTDDIPASLIYTSGTMGKPKGVILTHGNVVSNVNALHEVFLFDPDDRSLSFLPWAHAFGQIELHTFLSMGCSLALNRDSKELIDDLAEVKPTVLVAVPRIFERLY
ncbi:MAG TPA: AMP-binding protein, partial [Polyangiaceae bacterium]|nr:AMP-binding protein [Polyangiaceae bacterium]